MNHKTESCFAMTPEMLGRIGDGAIIHLLIMQNAAIEFIIIIIIIRETLIVAKNNMEMVPSPLSTQLSNVITVFCVFFFF